MKLNEQRKIYKLHSAQLRAAKWNLTLPLDVAKKDYPETIISLNDSQVLRWVDEINGIEDANGQIAEIKQLIKIERKKDTADKNKKARLTRLYEQRDNVQFVKDYLAVIMDRLSDYDRANKGFTVNGIRYRRFLGTNGGIKNSTIIYVNEQLYPILKERLDNGRNMEKELVPAKLEAYQALVCSGSTPIPEPNGIIVVNDCITHFKDNVITIADENDGEPELKHVDGYEVEHNNSDGCGLMLPAYSRRVNEFLTGDGETVISGFNTRYAWTKGMIFTFDFVDFAEKVAGTYEIIDAWGDKRDVRNAEVILTVSMLKLWDSYDSWEHYYENCQKNNYQFSTPKTTPPVLENVRTTNYQFLQSYEFTDEELTQLCKPTVEEISGALGADYRQSIVFMCGSGLTAEKAKFVDDDAMKALMIEPGMINDPYVRAQIFNNIKKKIELAKKGTIKVRGNYAIISGDLYALAQSMFNMEITGLLKTGEIYQKYWIDNGDSEVACFRAPMTCHNNIRRMRLNKSPEAAYWFRYITTASILNAWDTTCDALNGADFDGDMTMISNDPVLLAKTRNEPAIICVQRKAAKRIPTEQDLIESNKIAFNDEIGTITNHVTSMFEVQAGFPKESVQYKALEYRIMCGQLFQQNAVDRCKGIIAKPMPNYWYDGKEARERGGIDADIVAPNKPYFMRFVYPKQDTAYNTYNKNSNSNAYINFGKDIAALYRMPHKTEAIAEFLYDYELGKPLGENPCTVNRICWLFEDAFNSYKPSANAAKFDYRILSSGVGYTPHKFKAVQSIYKDYRIRQEQFNKERKVNRVEKDTADEKRQLLKDEFIDQCTVVCPDEDMLCDIVLDLCYKSEGAKGFAWDVCGHIFIKNLLQRNNNIMSVPVLDASGEFEFNGNRYTMVDVDMSGDVEE